MCTRYSYLMSPAGGQGWLSQSVYVYDNSHWLWKVCMCAPSLFTCTSSILGDFNDPTVLGLTSLWEWPQYNVIAYKWPKHCRLWKDTGLAFFSWSKFIQMYYVSYRNGEMHNSVMIQSLDKPLVQDTTCFKTSVKTINYPYTCLIYFNPKHHWCPTGWWTTYHYVP